MGFEPNTNVDEGIGEFVECYRDYLGCRQMRVLHIINDLGSGGAEKLIEETLPPLNKTKGIKADVLLLTDSENVFDEKLKDSGVNAGIVPIRNLYNPLNLYHIRKYIIEGEYDIVHAHLFPTFYWVSIASKFIFKNKPKFVMTEHSTHNRRRKRDYLRYLEKFIYSSYDKIISISQQTQDNLVKWLKPSETQLDRFIVIENGINIDRFKNAKPYNKVDICNTFTEDIRLVCMVARFSEQKDQPTLIKAIKELPENVHLLLIGEGTLKQKNENLAKEIGVSDKVHFLGFRNDVERILKTVDIVVLSSNWEGFGLAAAEGMAAGKPVIASKVEGLREIVDGYGLLFNKGDSGELSKLLNKLLNDHYLYKHISARCFDRAEDFSIDGTIQSIALLYENLLESIQPRKMDTQ